MEYLVPSESAEIPEFSSGELYGNFLQAIVILIVLIGCIVLLIRFLAAKNRKWMGNRSLQIYASLAVGQQKWLQVVEIGGAVYIVGVGENITLIDKIDDPAQAAKLLDSLAPQAQPSMGKAIDQLGQWIGGKRSRSEKLRDTGTETHAQEAFRELLQEKLKGLEQRKETLKAWMEGEPTQKRSGDE